VEKQYPEWARLAK